MHTAASCHIRVEPEFRAQAEAALHESESPTQLIKEADIAAARMPTLPTSEQVAVPV